MPYGIYLSAEGAQVQNKRLEVIAHNLANADTVGFKRQLAIAQARLAEAQQQGLDEPGSGSINDVGGGVEVRETRTDLRTGMLKRSGVPSHVAIRNGGFFAVDRGGERLLTRAGNFSLDEQGQLITAQGYPVLGEDGSPIVANGPIRVNSDGTVEDRTGPVGRLALLRPRNANDLLHAGENLFTVAAGAVEPLPEAERSVAGGYLELSGVTPVTEMMELIAASRAYEANVRMMQHQDAALGNLLGRVLRSS